AAQPARASSWSCLFENLAFGIQLHRRIVTDIDPDVYVRLAAEVPDERRTFQPPVVPFFVVAQVAVLVERETAGVEPALLLEAFLTFILILFAIRLDEAHEHLVDLGLLVARHLRHGQPGALTVRSVEVDTGFSRTAGDEGYVALLAIEHLVNFVRQQG